MAMALGNAEESFMEAIRHLMAKEAVPSEMATADWRLVDEAIRRRSLFSAQTTLGGYLEDIRAAVESIVNPMTGASKDRETKENPRGLVTSGLNPAEARSRLRSLLVDKYGYVPEEGKEGTLLDLSSDKRLDLVIRTNRELAQGAGKFVQSNADEDVVDLWPAWELVRYEDRAQPRDWEERWKLAAQVAGDVDAARVLEETGRMVALKSSDIWNQLGDGAGGYLDTLGNPYPPFAFNSGMWTDDVSREEAEEMGLLEEGEKAEPAQFDFGTLFGN